MQIDLVPRQAVLAANPVLARAIFDFQRASFDPDDDPFVAGQSAWDSDLDKSIVLTEEQAAAWNAETEAFFAAQIDDFDPVPPELWKASFHVAEFLSADFEDFTRSIAVPTRALFDRLGWSKVDMIGFSRAPYLEQENDAPEVAAAEGRLIAAGLTRDYNGAISADAENAARFLADYFWLARCNAAAPYLYVTAPAASTLLVPCKYANYHVETYTGGDASDIEAALLKSGFTLAPDGICEERFSDSGAIPGRKLPL